MVWLSAFLILCGTALLADAADGSSDSCVYYQEVAAGQSFDTLSPNYPYRYPNGIDCRWKAIAPSTSHFILNCSVFSIPKSDNCADDRFSVSPSGNINLTDAHIYCGTRTFSLETEGNRIVMGLRVPNFSKGGRFNCSLTATVPPVSPPDCDCGWKKQSRIVNGHETGVNEYPMMAGLMDFRIRLFCGATVISTRYCLTAAHCLVDRNTSTTSVLIGDHDIRTGSETNATRVLTAESFQSHPHYNSVTIANDIAVVRVTQDIVFSLEVGPACLPFRFPLTDVGTSVDVLGWGTTKMGWWSSDQLLETELDVINITTCQEAFGSKVSSTNQLCMYRNGSDACHVT